MTTFRCMLSVGALLVAGCVVPVTYDHSSKPLSEKQKDYVECLATANQATVGAGNWSSDRALRSAIFNNARDRYLAMCLESRGWSQGASPSSLPPPAPPRVDVRVFRQCTQVALSMLGLYAGPFDGGESSIWQDVWKRYVESHAELRNDERQSEIRRVIDQDLAVIHERMNWDACVS